MRAVEGLRNSGSAAPAACDSEFHHELLENWLDFNRKVFTDKNFHTELCRSLSFFENFRLSNFFSPFNLNASFYQPTDNSTEKLRSVPDNW